MEGSGVKHKILGIDLGTSYSCIAYIDEFDKPVVLPNSDCEFTTSSVVYFEDELNIVVGKEAKDVSKIYPARVVEYVKRSMGDPTYTVDIDGKSYRPEEISAYILKKLVQDAAQVLGEEITDVVITCPAYFGINAREATKHACELVNLNVRLVLNEPAAAAIYYGLDQAQEDQVILVYDLGGGTFDITVISLKENNINILFTGGNHNLGGVDWDILIADYFSTEFIRLHPDVSCPLDSSNSYQEILKGSEVAKISLTNKEKYRLPVSHDGELANIELTRDRFEELTSHLLEQTIDITKQVLEEAREKGFDKVDRIILVGGSSKMPCVARRITEEFGIEPQLLEPDLAVAKGAALMGHKILAGGTGSCTHCESRVANRINDQIDLKAVDDATLVKVAEFEESNYVKQTLSPAVTEFTRSGTLPDVFARYSLPLEVSDSSEIELATKTILSFWNKTKNNPKYEGLLKVLIVEHSQIVKELCDGPSRESHCNLVRDERLKQQQIKFKELDKFIYTVAGKGYLTPGEKNKLVAIFSGKGLTEPEILARIKVPIEEKVIKEPDTGLDQHTRRQVRAHLHTLGFENLYEFLAVKPGGTKPEVEQRIRELDAEWIRRKHDTKRMSAQSLISIARTLLTKGFDLYKKALIWDVVDDEIKPLVDFALLDNVVSRAEFEALIKHGVDVGIPEEQVRTAIMWFAYERGAFVDG